MSAEKSYSITCPCCLYKHDGDRKTVMELETYFAHYKRKLLREIGGQHDELLAAAKAALAAMQKAGVGYGQEALLTAIARTEGRG